MFIDTTMAEPICCMQSAWNESCTDLGEQIPLHKPTDTYTFRASNEYPIQSRRTYTDATPYTYTIGDTHVFRWITESHTQIPGYKAEFEKACVYTQWDPKTTLKIWDVIKILLKRLLSLLFLYQFGTLVSDLFTCFI